jgi:hypothetical protein
MVGPWVDLILFTDIRDANKALTGTMDGSDSREEILEQTPHRLVEPTPAFAERS